MRFPLSLSFDLTRYLMKKRLRGEEKFPLVLMLEPTHQCNLSCQGCGRIQEYRETLGHSLTLEECLQAVEDCGAPVVTITGGEPLLYPPVFDLLQELVHRGKHIYLCTNAILLEKSLPRLPHSDRLTLSLHVDGLAATHDHLLGRPGIFNLAIKAIKAAKAQGFRVCTNTSIYEQTDPREIEILLAYLGHIGVDGLLVSAGLQLRRGGRCAVYEPGGDQRQVQPLNRQRPQLQVLQHAFVPQLPPGGTGLRMHPLGQSHPQSPGVAGALLPDCGHPLPYLCRHDAEDPVGGLRGGPGLPLRPVHDAFRVRTHGGAADERPDGYLDHAPVES